MQRLALSVPLVRTLGRRVWLGRKPAASEIGFVQAGDADIPGILASFPWHPSVVSENLERQRRGCGTYVIGRDRGVVVTRGEVRWGDHHADPVREAYPGVPELNGLDVVRPLRSRGIGARLVGYLAMLARERGHERVGLGVVDGNARAERLYRRMGFGGPVAFTDEYEIRGRDGGVRRFADPATFLIADTAELAAFYRG